MYSTCLFCQASLGRNEVVEHFPIGRRLAFDAGKGRLWVVCRKCTRWNLTPIEERWEAIEECERSFSSTRMRASTDNVGLARLSEGLELVRIGKPQRPEFAAWRYGDDFGRRQRKALAWSGVIGTMGIVNFVSGTGIASMIGLASAGTAIGALYGVVSVYGMIQANRVRGRVTVPGEKRPALIRESSVRKIKVIAEDGTWRLRLPVDGGAITGAELKKEVVIEGDAALRAAASILAVANWEGADKKLLESAVTIVSERPDPSRLFLDAAQGTWIVDPVKNHWKFQEYKFKSKRGEVLFSEIPAATRLGLEMATNEDVERRAMEGELAMLEEAWKQAEEIAAIADTMDLGKPSDISARSEG
jgi:hypothetical protein